MKKILVTGSLGQIGSELVDKLSDIYGPENITGTDLRAPHDAGKHSLFEIADVNDGDRLFEIAKKYKVDTMIHLAALLSAKAETDPKLAWDINMGGLINALEVSRELKLQFFTPSSIGAFGPTTPKNNTPQNTLQRPTTMYGVNKVAGELLCDYYFQRYGVDTRSIRFPGLISYVTPPGGGTTDYAVEMFYEAAEKKSYTSYIKQGTYMDMMYMPDALDAIIKLMEADSKQLNNRNAYNISAFSAAPEDFENAIKKIIPDFNLAYDVDPIRQEIADSWPNNIDSSSAKEEWGFHINYDINDMTKDMIKKVMAKVSQAN